MGWHAILIAAVTLPLCLEGELLPIRSYTMADGLDSRGFLWFCTPEGLTVHLGCCPTLTPISAEQLLPRKAG
jgi:hypothetical protein